MSQSLRTCFLLVTLMLILTEASKKGGKKGGGWNSGNRNPSQSGGSWSNWNSGNRNPNQPGGSWSSWNSGNRNPNQPGGSWNNWGQNYNPGGGNAYNNKQWKPPKPKTNMKMIAAGAAVGAVGGFMIGSAVSNMRYSFDNDREYQYYNSYHRQMPNQVYRPMYGENTHVSQERFVSDCFNMSVTEFIIREEEGKNGSNIDPVERSVKTKIIRELCIHEYQRGSGLKVLFSPILSLFVTLFVYFVVQ
ncbi:major prion protein homolog [Spea bombifrons]|uniref:major prion protein homolog n=1 Tax=Spea bombifrons TaxID=233779 RepID=UPI00234BCEA8|nr:major prion protein homolog [Spea bombifrons]